MHATRCDPIATVYQLTPYHWNKPPTPFVHAPWDKRSGIAQLPIFLFRAQGCSRSFAYSLDVTGRNIPALTERTNWLFVGVIAAEQLEAHPETLRQLRANGFYIFKK